MPFIDKCHLPTKNVLYPEALKKLVKKESLYVKPLDFPGNFDLAGYIPVIIEYLEGSHLGCEAYA